MADADLQAPARPRQLKSSFERSGDELSLRCRSRGWGGGVFLLFWLCGWTVGCVFLAGMVINDPKLFSFLFAVPFWTAWFFVSALVLKAFLQTERLVLDRDGARYVARVLIRLKSRTVPLEEVVSFQRCEASYQHDDCSRCWAIEMRTLGHSLQMAQGLPEAELEYLVYELNEHLKALRGATPPESAEQSGDERRAARTALGPPSDCRWTRIDDFDEFGFAQRGRLSLAAIGGLLFINAFWNGVVSVFICVLLGVAPLKGAAMPDPMWWGLLVFLLPFEAIGLLMILGLVVAVLEPVRRSVWTVSRWAVTYRLTWLGLGPRWTWNVNALDRIEPRLLEASEKQSLRNSIRPGLSLSNQQDRFYKLVLIDKNNTEVCTMGNFTEGEACWIRQCMLQERADWFR